MNMNINKERLKETFIKLVRIDSPSKEERELSDFLKDLFRNELGCKVFEDDSMDKTGSNCGNLKVEVPGDSDASSLFFNAHLDTVEPGRGIKPIFRDGKFFTDGSTILGADDKAALAILIEVARVFAENQIPHPPLEFLFTVCEEIGLLGAKALDPTFLKAKRGYALDTTEIDILINQAPCATKFKVKILGKAAHSGLHPEAGISAIKLASKAISELNLGRIDEETTANIGIIRGGIATNIVPDETIVEGEVRSHKKEKLTRLQDAILGAFHKAVMDFREEAGDVLTTAKGVPSIQSEVINDYPMISIAETHPLIEIAVRAGRSADMDMKIRPMGGGSDANIFNGKGLETVIMGVGMQKVHSTEEFILLEDMVKSARLVIEIIKEWEKGNF